MKTVIEIPGCVRPMPQFFVSPADAVQVRGGIDMRAHDYPLPFPTRLMETWWLGDKQPLQMMIAWAFYAN